ncbi:MAG TPA: transposase [Ktedonobacteraceae bacterium]|nr:transposase [Ktedonobacteraceae bacterium]
MFRTRLSRDDPSNLTDAQWEILKPLIPPIKPDAAFSLHARRSLVDAIVYVRRRGCPWRALPHDFPAWQTVSHSFRTWRREGVWDRVLTALRMQVRIKQGREAEPSAANTLSQSIKTSAVRVQQKAMIWGKKRGDANDTPSLTARAICSPSK